MVDPVERRWLRVGSRQRRNREAVEVEVARMADDLDRREGRNETEWREIQFT
jgi:hypothetical protein